MKTRILCIGIAFAAAVCWYTPPAKGASAAFVAERSSRDILSEVNGRLEREFIGHDGLLLDYVGEIPTAEDIVELRPNAMGWYTPIENGSMFTGEWLPALMAEGAEKKPMVERCVRGLIKMSEISDVPGYIARATGTDGKSHFPCGSNDQTDPWFFALFSYCRWQYSDPALKAKALGRMVMVAHALEENGWKIPCDGKFKGENRGAMNSVKMPFWGATRFLFLLKALYGLTGDAHWDEVYRKVKAERLADIERGAEVDEKVFKSCYTRGAWIYVSSAEALAELIRMETDPADRERLRRGFASYAAKVAPLMKECVKYDNRIELPFKFANWREGYKWRPQETQKDAEKVSNTGNPEILGTHRKLERNYMSNPLAAAAICALQGDRRYREQILATLRFYDYSQANLSEFLHGAIAAAALLSADNGECDVCVVGEYDNVIHPGKADGSDFWNRNAIWFMYAPAFGFRRVDGATGYRFTVSCTNGGERVFTASEPTAPLVPVWRDVPVGDVKVVCEGMDADGKPLGKAGERSFLKVAGFREGAYPPPAKSFREAACGVYDYAFGMKALQHLLDTGKLDMSDPINSYASKACSGFINAMVSMSKVDPAKRERTLAIARKAAEYLIAGAEKGDAPLAWFPQTYAGAGEKNRGKEYAGLIMLQYPANAASAMVCLYEETGETRWLDYAEKIAGTYLKLQGEDGTWWLKMRASDGKPVNPNRLVPVQNTIPLFEALYRLTGKAEYRAAADRAFAYVERTRLSDWNWEGQFEDVPPDGKYENLTKHDAVSMAILLLERFPGDPKRLRQARELMRFAEDQFVCWEPPANGGPVRQKSGWHPSWRYDDWYTPCALEQYHCYWPIDASAAKIIFGYLALYRAERNPVDLAKARALGATMTRVQDPNGRIPTWWWKVKAGNDWMNCMFASARALLQLDKMRDER